MEIKKKRADYFTARSRFGFILGIHVAFFFIFIYEFTKIFIKAINVDFSFLSIFENMMITDWFLFAFLFATSFQWFFRFYFEKEKLALVFSIIAFLFSIFQILFFAPSIAF